MKKLILLLLLLFNLNSVFSQSDVINELINETDELNLDMWDFVEYAKDKITNKIELSKFFYYWIGKNVVYDKELIKRLDSGTITNEAFHNSQDEHDVYENRKGVCAGYANLYKWFMDEIDIEAVTISGHIRDERNHYVELNADDNFRHAWNAIKFDGKWSLVDTTWGTSDNITQSEYYYNINPELLIISHYPEEEKWQLLEKPLSLDEFNKSKFVKKIWFFSGYSDIPTLKADDEFYYLVYKSNANKNYSVELMHSSDNSNFSLLNNITKIEQDGFTYLRFPKTEVADKAYFKLNLVISKLYDNITNTFVYNGVINFKT